MKPLLFSICLVALGAVAAPSESHAQGFGGQGNLGFLPFGFYQPYGAQFGTTIRTPPYFATNPPVYYGTRYARPYGLSPFAAPPMLNAPASYTGRQAARFISPPADNPYVIESCDGCTAEINQDGQVITSKTKAGKVQVNPFVVDADRIANRY